MEPITPKKTGLGSSLLLRRTEPPAAPRRPDARDGQAAQRSADPETPATPAAETPETSRPKPPAAKHRAVPRDRCTLYLDQDVNERLDLAARIEGRERSEVASDLLRRHLPKYRVEREE